MPDAGYNTSHNKKGRDNDRDEENGCDRSSDVADPGVPQDQDRRKCAQLHHGGSTTASETSQATSFIDGHVLSETIGYAVDYAAKLSACLGRQPERTDLIVIAGGRTITFGEFIGLSGSKLEMAFPIQVMVESLSRAQHGTSNEHGSSKDSLIDRSRETAPPAPTPQPCGFSVTPPSLDSLDDNARGRVCSADGSVQGVRQETADQGEPQQKDSHPKKQSGCTSEVLAGDSTVQTVNARSSHDAQEEARPGESLYTSQFLQVAFVLRSSAEDMCSLLLPKDWRSLLRLNHDLWTDDPLHEIIVGVSAGELRRQLRHLSEVTTLGENEFDGIDKLLRFIVYPKVKGVFRVYRDDQIQLRTAEIALTKKQEERKQRCEDFLRDLTALLQKFIFWIEASLSTDTPEIYQQRRRHLRKMNLKVWFEAMREYRELSAYFFQVLSRWPLSFKDRDIFVQQFDGASLLALANFNDRESILWAFKFACRFSCGSAERVACTERYKFSAEAAQALESNQYADDVNVIVAALGYLSNVANCAEHWETLRELRIDEMCDNILNTEILRSHSQVEEFAEAIASTLASSGTREHA